MPDGFNAYPMQNGEGKNRHIAAGDDGAISLVRPETELFLTAGIGFSLALLFLWGATARIDEPVANLHPY